MNLTARGSCWQHHQNADRDWQCSPQGARAAHATPTTALAHAGASWALESALEPRASLAAHGRPVRRNTT